MPGSAPPAHYETSDVRIDKIVVGPFENNVFVVRDKGTGDAVIVDAANEHELLLEVSPGHRRPARCSPRTVTGTTSRPSRQCATPASRWASPPHDAAMLPSYDFTIPDDDVIAVGDLRLRDDPHARATRRAPRASCSRGTPWSSAATRCSPAGPATRSSRTRASTRSSVDRPAAVHPARDMLVLPGHGLDTTIGTERPHLDEWVERGW